MLCVLIKSKGTVGALSQGLSFSKARILNGALRVQDLGGSLGSALFVKAQSLRLRIVEFRTLLPFERNLHAQQLSCRLSGP